jgi:hypothetical protein
MATPASRFRAHGPTRDDPPTSSPVGLEVIEPPATSPETAVEFEVRVPVRGRRVWRRAW